MEAYNWQILTSLILTLRNVGPAPLSLMDFFVNGMAVPITNACSVPLNVGSTCTVTLSTSGLNPSDGVAYVIKIVSVDGAVFSYSAIAGSSS